MEHIGHNPSHCFLKLFYFKGKYTWVSIKSRIIIDSINFQGIFHIHYQRLFSFSKCIPLYRKRILPIKEFYL